MTKILVVEDEASFSEALSYVLGKEGFEVTVADTGDGAIAAFDKGGADLVLLDNMSIEECRAAVEIVAGRAKLEASGGLILNNAHAYAKTGVDYLAVGALTHSAPVLDIGLDLRME